MSEENSITFNERIEALTEMLNKSVEQNEALTSRIGELEETNKLLLNQLEGNAIDDTTADVTMQAYLDIYNHACGDNMTLDDLKSRMEG